MYIKIYIFEGCQSLLFVAVGTYIIYVLRDNIFHMRRIHPKLYTFFEPPPADVIGVIRSRNIAIFNLYKVDVHTKNARNEKHFNSTKRDNRQRRRRSDLLLV